MGCWLRDEGAMKGRGTRNMENAFLLNWYKLLYCNDILMLHYSIPFRLCFIVWDTLNWHFSCICRQQIFDALVLLILQYCVFPLQRFCQVNRVHMFSFRSSASMSQSEKVRKDQKCDQTASSLLRATLMMISQLTDKILLCVWLCWWNCVWGL